MRELIERLEKATGPDRSIDADIAVAVGGFAERCGLPSGGWVSKGPHHAIVESPSYTSSIDAALTLVLEGTRVDLHKHRDKALANVRFYKTDGSDGHGFSAWAVTLPIALCIAALKAREQDANIALQHHSNVHSNAGTETR